MNLFFYGTLRDEALLGIVLGEDAVSVNIMPAKLREHGVFWARGKSFPMIAPSTGALDGVLVQGLSDHLIERLNFYEGGFDYDLRQITVQADGQDHVCQVYWPEDASLVPDQPWRLSVWQKDWGDLSRIAAQEAMSYFKTLTPAQLAQRFPMIRARAQSKLHARKYAPPMDQRAGGSFDQLSIEHTRRSHAGFFALDVMQFRHPTFDGTTSASLTREVFVGTDAAIVLPYDPVSDQILLVEQFRMGPTGRHDPNPWCLEPVAGLVDAGETPEDCAIRESMEEADISLHGLEQVAKGYSSPGASSEYFFLYVGLCDLSGKTNGHGGLATEHEDIRTHILSYDRAMALVDSGEINVIPTVLCLNWLARHRSRLRRAA